MISKKAIVQGLATISLLTLILCRSFPNLTVGAESDIHLSYHIDLKKHKVVFNPAKITISIGQTVSIKNADLRFGGDFIDKLDFDWQTICVDNDYFDNCYFKGLKPGKCTIHCIYARNRLMTGDVEVTVTGDNPSPRGLSNIRKVYYRIDPKVKKDDEQEALIFTHQKIILEKGQKLIVMPKDHTVSGNVVIAVDNPNVIDENMLSGIQANDYIFKAKSVGKVKIEYHIAHEYFLKGTLVITVVDQLSKMSDAISIFMGLYEQSMIDAVNQNDFSIVESLLTPGSSLYQSQKNLVAVLNRQQIHEQLMDYEVEDVQNTDWDGVYKVYVHEKIGILYPGKRDCKISESDWVYTAVANGEKFSLSEIKRWN